MKSLTFAALVFAAIAPVVSAQNQGGARTPPHIAYIYPAGAKHGSTITVYVGGQNLQGTSTVVLSDGRGVTARVVDFERPLTQKEFNDLREKLQDLQKKRAAALGLPPPDDPKGQAKKTAADEPTPKNAAKKDAPPQAAPTSTAQGTPKPVWTQEDQKLIEELRAQIAKRPNRQGNPAIAETVTLEVTLPADITPGDVEFRLKSQAGISNPLVFQVGQLDEFTESVVTATTNPAPRGKREPNQRPSRPQAADTEITLPATVNGQILPGEVDRYRFAGVKGQRITVAVAARRLIPYLADAVPGWFQATVGLYDSEGREVAYSDSFRFSPDPVLSYEIPADGAYAIEVKDSIYRGREDFVYRIAIGELPFITSVFPLGGGSSGPATFELSGHNLPATKAVFTPTDNTPGTFLLSVRSRGQLSNGVRVALDAEPEVREAASNDEPAAAQALKFPVVVDGRIETAEDVDVFRLEGRAGDIVVAEVFARRLGSPLDAVLQLTDSTGKQLAANDDTEDKGAGLMTHHADPRLTLTLPADGAYFLTVRDTQHQGGKDYGYRLRVSPPRPDFELRVVPSGLTVGSGAHVPVTVYALRRDGFDGEIALSIPNGPSGFVLTGARVPPGQDKVQFTLTTPAGVRDSLLRLNLQGEATIGGEKVTRYAVPAEDMMQAFAYRHLVPAKEWVVNIVNRPMPKTQLLTKGIVAVPLGGTANVEVSIPGARGIQNLSVELSDPPAGISVKSSSIKGDVVHVVLACDAAKAKPGLKGNLIMNAFGQRTNPKAPKAAQRNARNPLGAIPAVMFEVVPATTTASANPPADRSTGSGSSKASR